MAESYAFEVGTRVRVLKREVEGHIRTPAYLMGKTGIVERQKGFYRKPEDLAYGKGDGEPAALYSISFSQSQIWPAYEGKPQDTVIADIFEYWLEPEA
jgi:nitrile hydratase